MTSPAKLIRHPGAGSPGGRGNGKPFVPYRYGTTIPRLPARPFPDRVAIALAAAGFRHSEDRDPGEPGEGYRVETPDGTQARVYHVTEFARGPAARNRRAAVLRQYAQVLRDRGWDITRPPGPWTYLLVTEPGEAGA